MLSECPACHSEKIKVEQNRHVRYAWRVECGRCGWTIWGRTRREAERRWEEERPKGRRRSE